jgi:hypothetical protein
VCTMYAICEATLFMTCNSFSCITVNIPSGANLGSNGNSVLNIVPVLLQVYLQMIGYT